MVRILDEDEAELASADGLEVTGPATVRIQAIRKGRGQLLNYYFGRGRRRVTLELHGLRFPATLQTEWGESGREWTVRLRRPAGQAEIAAAGDVVKAAGAAASQRSA